MSKVSLHRLGLALALVAGIGCFYPARYYAWGPPPVAVVESAPPAPGPGYVWVPGYYRWNAGEYVWARGRWVLPPAGYSVWVPGVWLVHGRRWLWRPGHWR